MRYGFGIDIGGTTVKLALYDEDRVPREKWEIPTDTSENGVRILPDIASSVREHASRRGLENSDVIGIGVGAPGFVTREGVALRCVNLGWQNVDVKGELERLTGYRVEAGNDANVAALGEIRGRSGKQYRDAVMLTLGTGVGGGILSDGKLVIGARGIAGELGHVTVEPEETACCNCGKKGCLEQYASATGVVNVASRILRGTDEPSALRSLPSFSCSDVFDLAKEGDALAFRAVDRSMEYLGKAMAQFSLVLDPEAFIIGGGVSHAGEFLQALVEKHYRNYAIPEQAGAEVVLAEVGNAAGALGAFCLLQD